MTRKYEMVYVLNPSLGEEELAAANERIATIVNANGSVESVESWGRKRLAYEINDLREGIYHVMLFNSDAEGPKEIERLMRINDDLLRYLIVREEK